MTNGLDTRLHRYSETLDAAISVDVTTRSARTRPETRVRGSIDSQSNPRFAHFGDPHRALRRNRHTAAVGEPEVRARELRGARTSPPGAGRAQPGLRGIRVCLAVAGVATSVGLIWNTTRDQAVPDRSAASVPTTTIAPTPIGTLRAIDEGGHNHLDTIQITPRTIGWFVAGTGLPPDLAKLPISYAGSQAAVDPTEADPLGPSALFECASWTANIPDDGHLAATCSGLVGGDLVSQVNYGDRLGIGVDLGSATTAQELLWMVADGGLWGYERFPNPPVPTEVAVGDATGYLYRNGDRAVLAWEHSPGVLVWLQSTGIDDATLATIARGTYPAPLPDRLALPLVVGPAHTLRGLGDLKTDQLKWASIDGHSCVGFTVTRCTPLDGEPHLITEAFDDQMLIGAVWTAGDIGLRVHLTSGDIVDVPRTFVGLEPISETHVAQYRSGDVAGFELVDGAGASIPDIAVQSTPPSLTTIVVGGPLDGQPSAERERAVDGGGGRQRDALRQLRPKAS